MPGTLRCVGHDVDQVQPGNREWITGCFEREMSGVVRAHEEVAAGPGQTIDAGCKHGAHRFVIPALPRGHAVLEGDAVHGDIRMCRVPETVAVLTDLTPAQRGTFPAVAQDSDVFHPCTLSVLHLWSLSV